jgi:hypothetical protein
MFFSFFPDTSSGSRLDKNETKNQARLTCRQGFASSAFGHLLLKRREMEMALTESYEFSWLSFAPAAYKAWHLKAILQRLMKYTW